MYCNTFTGNLFWKGNFETRLYVAKSPTLLIYHRFRVINMNGNYENSSDTYSVGTFE